MKFPLVFLARDLRLKENPTRIVTASGDVLDGVDRGDIYGIFPSMLDAFRDCCIFMTLTFDVLCIDGPFFEKARKKSFEIHATFDASLGCIRSSAESILKY